jgi:hypothetical protein
VTDKEREVLLLALDLLESIYRGGEPRSSIATDVADVFRNVDDAPALFQALRERIEDGRELQA